MIEGHGITIIRTNPDAAEIIFLFRLLFPFLIFLYLIDWCAYIFALLAYIRQIYKLISQSNKEKLEKEKEVEIKKLKNKIKKQETKIKEQKGKFAKELLIYVSSISTPVKHIKYFVKKILATL